MNYRLGAAIIMLVAASAPLAHAYPIAGASSSVPSLDISWNGGQTFINTLEVSFNNFLRGISFNRSNQKPFIEGLKTRVSGLTGPFERVLNFAKRALVALGNFVVLILRGVADIVKSVLKLL